MDWNNARVVERQVTRGSGGRILTNVGVWSPDSQWLVYDTRSDAAGDLFDGEHIEIVHVETGEVRRIYTSRNGARCGVATFHPAKHKVVFILGPENPDDEWSYNAFHRQGVVVDSSMPEIARNLDARDITPPFTPGALRGGSHVHTWDGTGEWVSFTYEDHVLAVAKEQNASHDQNQRNIGVSAPVRAVVVRKDHPRNHDGDFFSVLVTTTVSRAKPGSDEIERAFEEGWVGTNGYTRADGSRQRRALAFQGLVRTDSGKSVSEVFIVDIPDHPTREGDGLLCGTEATRPRPPKGTVQRRLSFTTDRRFPGLQGPRHWLRTPADGSRIAFLMKDDAGVVQIWTVSPNGGKPQQLTRNEVPVTSAFTWSTDGHWLAHTMDNSVCVTDGRAGHTRRLTPRSSDEIAPRPEACVFSPDGQRIAFVRTLPGQGNHICVLEREL